MNIDNFDKDVAKELFVVLSYCDETFIKNIPNYMLEKISISAADSLKEVYVDKNKSLMEQEISDDCKELIAGLYFMYMTDSATKKDLLNKLLNNN